MLRKAILVIVAIAAVSLAPAQSPPPVVVQAVAPANPPSSAAPQALSPSVASETILQTLLQLKAANEEMLRKQAATLLQVEEMEKAADQIKIYTKRG